MMRASAQNSFLETVADVTPPVLLCNSAHHYNNSKVINDCKFEESMIA